MDESRDVAIEKMHMRRRNKPVAKAERKKDGKKGRKRKRESFKGK